MIVCNLVAVASYVNAQDKKNERRLTFGEWAAFYSNGSTQDNIGNTGKTSPSGSTVGLIAYWNVPYESFEDKDFVLGWNANFAGGWNLTKSRAGRYDLDIGFWSSKLIKKDIEVGVQYSFLGIYCYQDMAFFGSSAQAAVRVTDFQVTYSREGEGVFIGWASPKNKNMYANSIGAKYFFGKNLFLGGRFTKYPFNKEYAIVAGLTGF